MGFGARERVGSAFPVLVRTDGERSEFSGLRACVRTRTEYVRLGVAAS